MPSQVPFSWMAMHAVSIASFDPRDGEQGSGIHIQCFRVSHSRFWELDLLLDVVLFLDSCLDRNHHLLHHLVLLRAGYGRWVKN